MNARRPATLALAAMLAAAVPLAACTTKSASTYKPSEAGQAMDVSRATVLRSRPVVIEGLKEGQTVGWGAAIGAATAGAATYGLTEADTPLGVAVTIIAAIGGALAGTVAEEQLNRNPGAEYVLEPESGKTFAVVQTLTGDDKVLPPGEHVLVIQNRQGFYRVVPDK